MSVLETSVNSKDLILQDSSHYVEIYDILVFKATRVEFRKSCVLSLEYVNPFLSLTLKVQGQVKGLLLLTLGMIAVLNGPNSKTVLGAFFGNENRE